MNERDPGSVYDSEPVLPKGEETLPQIDNYRILQRIGEGGMGEVYEAEQQEPVHRRVAVKVIKHGMDTKQVVVRFESERQALAMMNHPSIARVFEAGATRRGRPYFAMEFVRGEPIVHYCNRYRLDITQRLEAFVQVCDGIQHAHQKGVIHRDIKPSNVLIQVEGDKAVPKIIDFGIAKAVEQPLTERTAFTAMGQLIGTPEYMSPEQADDAVQDIDTRTDVYSLGVMLYGLLVGALPFDPQQRPQTGFEEFRRRICEEDAAAPSSQLRAMADPDRVARDRRTDVATLTRRLRRDLDWITLKALEKDRTRRYGSPAELAADIERHLQHQPVQARPPSTSYRLGKFVKRHRVGVALAAGVSLMLVAFAGVMLLQAARIVQQRNRANQEAEAAKQVAHVLNQLFDLANPGEALGQSVTAGELLDIGLQKVRASLADQPRELAQSLGVIGDSYRGLGLYDKAQPLLEEGLQSRRRLLGEEHPDTLASMGDLARLYVDQGRYDEAEELSLAALGGRRHAFGATHRATLESMNDLAGLYRKRGQHDQAETFYLETLEARRSLLGREHKDTAQTMNDLAGLYWNQGRHDEAEALYQDTLETRRRLLGAEHTDTAETMNDLAVVYWDRGRYEQAEPLFLEVLRVRRQALSENHPETLVAMNNLALLYDAQGRYDEAEPLHLNVLEVQRRILGEDHPQTLTAMNNLAGLYWSEERYDEAEPLMVGVLAGLRETLGEHHSHTLSAMGNLGDLYTTEGRLAAAEPLLDEASAGSEHALGAEHPLTGISFRKHGRCLTHLERYDQAHERLLAAHEILTASFGSEHMQTLKATRNLAELYEAWGRTEEAIAWRSQLPDSPE